MPGDECYDIGTVKNIDNTKPRAICPGLFVCLHYGSSFQEAHRIILSVSQRTQVA
jgi:hypothetical protein